MGFFFEPVGFPVTGPFCLATKLTIDVNGDTVTSRSPVRIRADWQTEAPIRDHFYNGIWIALNNR
jgi:hypothetical protein